jgi:hypothetical protein
MHLMPIPYPARLIANDLPAPPHDDNSPDLIAPGETVDIVVVGTVLIAYDWLKADAEHLHPKWRKLAKLRKRGLTASAARYR